MVVRAAPVARGAKNFCTILDSRQRDLKQGKYDFA